MTPRRPPVRHSVRGHYRRGEWVDSFERGRGKKSSGKRKVVKWDRRKVDNQAYPRSGPINTSGFGYDNVSPPTMRGYKGYRPGETPDSPRSGNLSGEGHFTNWTVDGVPVKRMSYVLSQDKVIFQAYNNLNELEHATIEVKEGHSLDDGNKDRVVRVYSAYDNKGEPYYTAYSYGRSRTGRKGTDSHPKWTATALRKLQEKGLLSGDDRIGIYFDEKMQSTYNPRIYTMKDAITGLSWV